MSYFQPDTYYTPDNKKVTRIPAKDMKTFYGRAKHLYYIRTKDNVLATYVPHQGQKIIGDIIDTAANESIKTRGVSRVMIQILKPRQIGATTDTACRIFDMMLRINMCNALVTNHLGEDTEIIFDKYQILYRNLPDYIILLDDKGKEIVDSTGNALIPLKPEDRADSAKQIRFSEPLSSWINVRTAGSGDNLGKGGTLNAIHFCLGENSKIIKANGESTTIKDIKIGDSVVTGNGNITKIKEKFDTGKKETYQIKTWLTNEIITASKDHKILTHEGWKKTEDLTSEDYIKIPKVKLTNKITKVKHKLYYGDRWYTGKGITEGEIELTKEFGFFLGYYLAEGHIKPQNKDKTKFTRIEFFFHRNEIYYQRIAKFVEPYVVSTRLEHKKDKLTSVFYCTSRWLAELVNKLVGRVDNKHIPEWFFDTNKEFLEGVLEGFISGDGSKTVNKTNVKKRKNRDDKYVQAFDWLEEGYTKTEIARKLNVSISAVSGFFKRHKGKTKKEYKDSLITQDFYWTNKCVLTTTQEKIARQLKRIIVLLDYGVPSFSQRKTRRYNKKTKDRYDITGSGILATKLHELIKINHNLPVNSRSQKYLKKRNDWYVKVKEIIPNGLEQTYDIEVYHNDHSFETVIGIVSNSESANYLHYSKATSSSLQQIPDNAETLVVNESTANGTTGSGEGYYKDWVIAEANWKKYQAGEMDSYEGYIPVFVPWYVIDEYQLPLNAGKFISLDGIDFGGPEGKEKFLEKEVMLMTEYNVSPERINWYRYIIKTKCGNSLNEANRYYPTFPEDAFLSTDKCFFDSNKLFGLKKAFDDHSLVIPYEEGNLNEDLEFVPMVGGDLHIYEHPDPNSTNRYICSIDTSKGVEDGDYTSMKVLDRLTEKWVASWHGKIAEDIAAKEFIKLCIYYNYALAMPEANRATVIDLIKPGGFLEYEGEIYYSKVYNDGTYEYGFHTSPGAGATSRKLLLDRYKAWLRDNYDKFNNVEDVEEHLSFVRTVSQRGTVRFEADQGKKDDRVMCMALAITANLWWEEEVGILNDEKTDYKAIVKVNAGRKNSVMGYKQSSLGGEKKVINNVHKITTKQSSLGFK